MRYIWIHVVHLDIINSKYTKHTVHKYFENKISNLGYLYSTSDEYRYDSKNNDSDILWVQLQFYTLQHTRYKEKSGDEINTKHFLNVHAM